MEQSPVEEALSHPDTLRADPTLTKAFDLRLEKPRHLPTTARAAEWAGGWTRGMPPGISTDQWPLSPASGHPMRHAFTLHVPPEYRTQGQERVAISVFVDDQAEEFDSCSEIEAFFDAPLSATPPDDASLHAFWCHRRARHLHQHDMKDILGTAYAALWLTQDEFDAALCLPPHVDSALVEGHPMWLSPGTYGTCRDADCSREHTTRGCMLGVSTACAISAILREGDPNVGKPAREWEHECEASGYIPAFSDEGTALDLGRWSGVAHLGGTMTPVQGYPDFGPYYLEFEESFGEFNFGTGNAQLDLQQMELDWACG